MKVAILHLSDLHIDSDNYQWLINKTEKIVAAVWSSFCECGKIIIVVSGDIAYSGKEEQYKYAKDFFRALLSAFAQKNLTGIDLDNRIICVPGNHDCDFDKEDNVRKILLERMKEKEDQLDVKVYETVSAVQDEYRDFARIILGDKDYTLSVNSNIRVKVGDKSILFRLYNTAWMSSLKESQNSIIMPMNLVAQEKYNSDLVISLFHHYYSWITPECDNNKTRFRKHIIQSSNMVIYGHEHTPSSNQVRDNFEGEEINEFEGGALCYDQAGRERASSFNGFVVDMESYECLIRSYDYVGGIYSVKRDETIDLNSDRKTDEFRHNHEYLKSLKKMSVPIYNSENIKMTLDEFFVYPDLERVNARQINVDEGFTDSSSLLDGKRYRLVLLEGDDQCGKTSLLNMYYLRFVDRYMYPILINGKNIVNENLDRIIGRAFSDQYNRENQEKYSQYDKEKKIVLIDDFDECLLNNAAKKKVIDQLLEQFQKVIITTMENENVSSSFFLMEKDDTFVARIKPLGHVKRNELVNKFYSRYNVNSSTLQQQALFEQVKAGFDMVENFLGREYMPSFPIYILSILLSNAKSQGSTLEQTSYGYCYEALITCALMSCLDDKTKIDTYYNVLISLAYNIFKKKGKPISETEFEVFYDKYQKEYFAEDYNETKRNLLKCNLLRCIDDSYYKFSYNYIYYFLVAKFLADKIFEKEGQDEVMDLCVNIHDEQKANILIFIAHHIKAPQFIDATSLALMTALEDQLPVTLDKDDRFYKLVNELCESLKKEIISPEEKINPEKEREKILRKRDDHENHLSKEPVNPNDQPTEIRNMNKSLRSIEVVGQIVKNRQGSLPKSNIKSMVREMFMTAFRTVSYYGAMMESDRKQVMDDVVKNKKEGTSNDAITKKIDAFFELTSLNFCLFVFSKVIKSVGNKELRNTFVQIADEIGTPAAKLLSFSITSCYSKIAIDDLEKLISELKDNPVAMSIIRARVRSYLYNNFVPIARRQKIIDTVNLNPRDSQIKANAIPGRRKR